MFLEPTILASAARTATVASQPINVEGCKTANIYLKSAAGTGTTPTLDVTIQDSPDGTNWYTVDTAFTQVTNAASTQVKRLTNFGKFLRVNCVIAGTSPSFTFQVDGNFKS